MKRYTTFLLSALTLFVLGEFLFLSINSTHAQKQDVPDTVPGQYIVVLKEGGQDPQGIASDMAKIHGLSPEHIYSTVLRGFSATIPAARLERVRGDSRVQFISEDRIVQAT